VTRRSSSSTKRLIQPLEQEAYARLQQAGSLKGLLKPFKSKGELVEFSEQCAALRDSLIVLAQRLLSEATAYPFSLLPVLLAQQTTEAGTAFLRWRSASAMGVSLWADLVNARSTPVSLLPDLYALELQRVALNMQVSLTHSIARLAMQSAQKMAHAESVYRRRVDQDTHRTHKEPST
jgi:hypothetical protein